MSNKKKTGILTALLAFALVVSLAFTSSAASGTLTKEQIDAVVGTAPENVLYPVIIEGMPQPQLRIYPRYTVVAEKLEAMVKLGILNSRMKDYFDLWVLAGHSDLDGAVLAQAIGATFERRGTVVPSGLPLGLTDEFGLDEQKTRQWQAFLRKNTLESIPLAAVISAICEFLLPVLAALAAGEGFDQHWRAGAGWSAV